MVLIMCFEQYYHNVDIVDSSDFNRLKGAR